MFLGKMIKPDLNPWSNQQTFFFSGSLNYRKFDNLSGWHSATWRTARLGQVWHQT